MNCEEKLERKKKLQNLLQDFKIDFKSDIQDIDRPLLLILDYSPKNKCLDLVSFAFSLSKYYEGIDHDFENRFWATRETLKKETERLKVPTSHPDYTQFEFKDNTFYPFSAQLGDYNFCELEKMKELLKRLHNCIDFS